MSDKINNEVSITEPVAQFKKRETVHLPWYKTQYWSGFIFGFEVGLLTGIPFAFVAYQIAKVVVHFIEGLS